MGIVEEAKQNNYVGVDEALARGEDVNSVDEFGNTALMCMASQGNFEMTQKLVKAGADPYLQCQAIGRKGWVAMDFALQTQEQTVRTVPGVNLAKIVALLSPPDAEEDEMRGLEELEEQQALEKQQPGKLCAGVKLKHQT
mmetsp:Transcript_4993/g.9389  ORF Transcript_4993/g.9389 Transcript_4993/m.9389 type:complete len:140 (-) Transcript_4993:145-564(-)|eukprot:CAMPEP_0114242768 /NCGR_PEP_ID=MMETSP0058-20121206/10367_1 /TAXON_ID=36894 /ORGANISM="Pyramimonas parkeae, CCMP726" /LENGTH=139 /DNA_ID=CAMNT_0001355433 /DNA_START=55 /DNA_END=474 /DNA_ORIENTATION=+